MEELKAKERKTIICKEDTFGKKIEIKTIKNLSFQT